MFDAGFIIDHNGRALRSCKTIVITLSGPSLKVGDVIVEYKAGAFVQVGVVKVNGTATIDVRGVTEIAILAPKG